MPSRHWCGPWRRPLVGAAGAHKTLQRTANITTQRCYEAAAVATKTNEPKTQHGCTLDGNLNYHFCLAGGRMVSQRQSTRPGPWLRGLFGVHRGPRQPGVSWCESSPPLPPPPSVMVGVDLKGFCIHVVLSPEQPSMLKAKVLKTTSSTLINYAKVLRSHTRTSVYVQPSRVKCEPLRINIKQTVWHGHHVKCSHHPCTEPTSCQHCSRRGLKKAHGACDWRRRRRRLGATGKLLELLVPPVSGTDHFGIANWLGKQLVPLVLYSSMTSRWIVLARSQASQPMWKSASKNSGS